jgi:hypothetical protein
VNRRYNFACCLVKYLNDPDAALDVLEPAMASMARAYIDYARTDPDFDPVRRHPRFQAMLAQADARLAATE